MKECDKLVYIWIEKKKENTGEGKELWRDVPVSGFILVGFNSEQPGHGLQDWRRVLERHWPG